MSSHDSFPQKGLVVPGEDEKEDNMLGMVILAPFPYDYIGCLESANG